MNFLGRISLGALKAYSRIAPTERGGFRLARMGRALAHPQGLLDQILRSKPGPPSSQPQPPQNQPKKETPFDNFLDLLKNKR